MLWLCGPAGVGKSTASWQLFTELTRAGAHVAFADTDQLCMCYPAPLADPGRELLKAQNLAAMLASYRAAGACCMIVNGVVDPVRGVYRDVLSQAALTVCRLRADRDELARRFTERHGRRRPDSPLLRSVLSCPASPGCGRRRKDPSSTTRKPGRSWRAPRGRNTTAGRPIPAQQQRSRGRAARPGTA